MSLRYFRTAAALAVLGLAGCQHMCRKQACPPVILPARPGPGGNIVLPTPVPATAQPLPSGSFAVPRPAVPAESSPPPLATDGPGVSGKVRSPEFLLPDDRTPPPAAPAPPPTPPPFAPRAEAPTIDESSFALLPLGETPSVSAKPRIDSPEFNTVVPPPAPPTATLPSLPADIAGFAVVKGKTASGRRPGVEGHDWLKAAGYRAVLNLRRPGEDDSTDRKAAESRGMRYLTLEVSAATLTPALAEAFHRAVGSSENQPLFVYDRDGELAGALWLVHLRQVDGLTEEAARAKAGRLGLRAGDVEQAAARLPANRGG